MKTMDTQAADALAILLSGGLCFSPSARSGWSRFISSLVLRNPEMVLRAKNAARELISQARSAIEEDYAKNRRLTDPATYAKYVALHSTNPEGQAAAILLQKVIDSQNIGGHLNNMRWGIHVAPRHGLHFLTSDRPVIMTNGIVRPNAQLILPISKRHLFFATNNIETENQIIATAKEGTIVQMVNNQIVLQARKLVFASDDTALKFVAKRLGKQFPASPIENGEPSANGF